MLYRYAILNREAILNRDAVPNRDLDSMSLTVRLMRDRCSRLRCDGIAWVRDLVGWNVVLVPLKSVRVPNPVQENYDE